MYQWKKMREKAPDKQGLYLICNKKGRVACANRQNIFFKDFWNADVTGGFSIIPDDDVEFWAELPEAPAECFAKGINHAEP